MLIIEARQGGSVDRRNNLRGRRRSLYTEYAEITKTSIRKITTTIIGSRPVSHTLPCLQISRLLPNYKFEKIVSFLDSVFCLPFRHAQGCHWSITVLTTDLLKATTGRALTGCSVVCENDIRIEVFPMYTSVRRELLFPLIYIWDN